MQCGRCFLSHESSSGIRDPQLARPEDSEDFEDKFAPRDFQTDYLQI